MRSMSIAAGALLVLMNTSCGGGGGGYGPTEQEIINSLNETLRSVAGDWTGIANAKAPNSITFEFRLQEGNAGQITGTGTMKEQNAASAVPITITGTFQRPALTLVFAGMVYESRQVTGAAQGNYITVGGVGNILTLTAPGYTRDLPILLQEKL